MEGRARIGILCGGRSAEHEVSLQSAKNVLEAIDTGKFEPVVIGITKQGAWRLYEGSDFLRNPGDPLRISLSSKATVVTPVPGGGRERQLVNAETGAPVPPLDAVFPILHGTYGEDGTLQGLLDLCGIPYAGADVLGSAVGMDKDVMKRLLRDAGIPIARYRLFRRGKRTTEDFRTLSGALGAPLFVKPANMGSSVGVSRVNSQAELDAALTLAFRFDTKVIVEEAVPGREIECAVLGNDQPAVSVPGEVLPQLDFYSYEAKYVDENGAMLKIPADLPSYVVDDIQALAVKTFKALECSGLARVDFFLTENDEIVVNEINTLPGFTRISMYPKLWEATGISYKELITRLIELGLERAAERASLETAMPRK